MQTLQIDELRRRLEHRLTPAIEAWEEAKRNLEAAIALAETREKEYHALAEDVEKRLAALNAVVEMSNELMSEVASAPEPRPAATPAPHPTSLDRLARAVAKTTDTADTDKNTAEVGVKKQEAGMGYSSRPLFPANWRAKSQLSILP